MPSQGGERGKSGTVYQNFGNDALEGAWSPLDELFGGGTGIPLGMFGGSEGSWVPLEGGMVPTDGSFIGSILPSTPTAPLQGALVNAPPTLASAAANSTGNGSLMSALGKFFGRMDPTLLGLAGLSLLGGDDGGQELQSYSGSGHADPRASLNNVLSLANNLFSDVQNRGPRHLRSSYVPAPPGPVQIPGLPFQIGGGLGTDPAIQDPTLLSTESLNIPAQPANQPRRRKATGF
jgi:hypothetical protein